MSFNISSILNGPSPDAINNVIQDNVVDLIEKHGFNAVSGMLSNGLSGQFLQMLKDEIQNDLSFFSAGDPLIDAAIDVIDQGMVDALVPVAPGLLEDVLGMGGDGGEGLGALGGMLASEVADTAKKEVGAGGTPKNFLVALAKAMGELQAKYMDAAMENIGTMHDNAPAVGKEGGGGGGGGGIFGTLGSALGTAFGGPLGGLAGGMLGGLLGGGGGGGGGGGSESSGAFMTAQAEFGANMQLFKMTAESTSTMLKSVGEGLSSVARKQ